MSYFAPSPTTEYLFIDGAYVRELIREYGRLLLDDDSPEVDWGRLAPGYTKTFYYDCPPPRNVGEDESRYDARCEPYWKHIQALREMDGWHMFEGTTKKSKKRGSTQKEIDVALAVDLLSHTFRRNMSAAALFAGDQDFRPVVDAAVREGMRVKLHFSKLSVSSELKFAADSRIVFSAANFLYMLVGRSKRPMVYGLSTPDSPASEWAPQGGFVANREPWLHFFAGRTTHVFCTANRDVEGRFMRWTSDDLDLLQRFHAHEFGASTPN